MTCPKTSNAARVTMIAFVIAAASVALGCNDGGSAGEGGNVIEIDAGPVQGCVARIAPSEEPDLLADPFFLRETAPSGATLEADVDVDAQTKTVIVELMDYWSPDERPLATQALDTRGDEVLPISFETEPGTRGRYFLRITLCGSDCDERQVVFTLVPDPDDPNQRNVLTDRYVRSVVEADSLLRSERTCLGINSVVVQ